MRKYGVDFKHVEKVGEIVKGEIYLLEKSTPLAELNTLRH